MRGDAFHVDESEDLSPAPDALPPATPGSTSARAPYPWSNGDGLCNAIRDPMLWSRALNSRWRQVFRPIFKRAGGISLGPSFSVADDERFGHAVVALLSSRVAREKAARFYESHHRKTDRNRRRDRVSLQTALARVLRLAIVPTDGLPPDDLVNSPGDGSSVLDPSRFEPWLTEHPPEPQHAPAIVQLACTAAMLKPSLGQALFNILVQSSTEVAASARSAPQLEPSSAPSATHRGESPPSTSALPPDEPWIKPTTSVEDPPAPARAPLSRRESTSREKTPEVPSSRGATDEVTALLRDLARWDQFPIDTLRRGLAELQKAVQSRQDRLLLLDELRIRVEKTRVEIGAIPWLTAPLPPDTGAALSTRETLESAFGRLSALETATSRVFNIHLQLSALTERLERSPIAFIPRGVTSLAEIAAVLEEEAERRKEELTQKAMREARALALIERCAALDPADEIDELVRDTVPMDWLDLLAFLGSSRRPEANLRGKHELAGIAAAVAWAGAPRETALLLEPLVLAGAGSARGLDLLGYLGFAELRQLAEQRPALLDHVAELMFAAAVVSDQLDALDYLANLLSGSDIHPVCSAVYRAFFTQRTRGTLGSLRTYLGRADEQAAATAAARETALARDHLLETIRSPPGMRGNYHRLRVVARAEFLAPLDALVQAGDSAAVKRGWASFGPLEEMVEQCARASGRKNELGDTHYRQTRAYLAGFEAGIERWHRLGSPTQRTQTDEALAALRKEAELARSAPCISLQRTVDRLAMEGSSPDLPGADFGRRCEVSPSTAMTLVSWQERVSPRMVFCWPAVVTVGSAPLTWFLVDRLREARGAAPADLRAAAQVHLRVNALLAARRAVQGDDELEQVVEAAIALKIEAIRREHEALLAEAHAARPQDEFIDLWLNEIEEALRSLELESAAKQLVELDGLIRRYRWRTDPARRACLDFLRDAGQPQPEEMSTEELLQRMATVRFEQRDRRIHIDALEALAQDEVFSISSREGWTTVIHRVDQPLLWPDDELSLQLSEALTTCRLFMRGKLRHRAADPDTVDLLVSRLEEWIPERLEETLESPTREQTARPLLGLAEEIRDDAPERRVLHLLGGASPRPTFALSPAAGAAPRARDELESSPPPSRTERRERTLPPPIDVTAEVRRFLLDQARREQRPPTAEPAVLRSAVHRKDWRTARSAGATLILEDHESTEATLSGVEIVYAVALTHAPPDDDAATLKQVFRYACSASVLRSPDVSFYGLTPYLDGLLPRALPRLLIEDGSAGPEHLSEALTKLSEMSSGELIYRWLADVLAAVSGIQSRDEKSGSALLAMSLWNALTGVKDSARPRCNLLHVLYRMRRFEALRYLAHTARPFDDLISQCLTVFERAEVDPELRLPAHQISSALYEQSRGRANTKAWTLLFARIEPSGSEAPSAAVTCSIDDTTVGEEPDGTVILPIRLTPALDLPESLRIRIGDENAPSVTEIPVDEILVKEMLILGRVPRLNLGSSRDQLEVPYRITGQTIRGNKIDVRGAWTLRTAQIAAADPLHEDDLRLGWPGASGDPVTSADSFHGRKLEIKNVERYLLADERQRSVMIFGQRRIGKTSILCQMVAGLPPGQGRVAAAFLDVSGLAVEKTSIAKRFFDLIVAALESDAKNEPIRAALSDRVEIAHLARGLTPAASFHYALEGLLERMKRESRGAISRFALFVDEFDRFVEPLLADQQQRHEVEQLMWQLRQIVQHSQSISLVLAGSGLQRLLVDDYAAPLFGSIAQVEIPPFDWERDREAVEQTFVQERLRDRLCTKGAFAELAQRAHQLSDGHPYYLAMLGYSAALLSAGRPMTPASLNRTVDAMISGTVRGHGPRIDAVRFYGPIFESLKRLRPRIQAIAKLILVQVAQRTTPEFPWLSVSDGSAGVDLRETDDLERLDAFKALTGEGALNVDASTGSPRVRIRIPLTAAALRQDATILREEGNRELRTTARGGRL